MIIFVILLANCCRFALANQLNDTHFLNSPQHNNFERQIYEFPSDPVKWLCFNTSEEYNCCQIYFINCDISGPLLPFGYCATYSENNSTKSLSIANCPYLQHKYYNVTTPDYITLPVSLNELNDYMCGPLNRKGLLCSECADGFGYSLSSFSYKCVNCTNTWYNIPVYLVAQFVPTTILYIVILVFRLSAISPPMPCFIMYAQLVVFGFDLSTHISFGNSKGFIFAENGNVKSNVKIIDSFYGLFNQMDEIIFQYVLPPLCLSTKLKQFHIFFLGYISVFYPVFLIVLTWVCVSLHDYNFRPFVWLWRPFHKCFVRLRRDWDIKSDLVDVFITFFLLSYAKCSYMVIVLSSPSKIQTFDESGNASIRHCTSIDPSIDYMGHTHLGFMVAAYFICIVFNILPFLYLTLYPFGAFQRCLSKCRLDFIAVNTFADKIHSCYKNGLDGGKDMRSLSGMYFFSMIVMFLIAEIFQRLERAIHSRAIKLQFSIGVSALIMLLIVATTKPYKKMYMNFMDTLLLSCLALQYFAMACELYQITLTLLYIPMLSFFLVIVIKSKVVNRLRKVIFSCKFNGCIRKLFIFCQRTLPSTRHPHTDNSEANSPTSAQPLIQPTSSEIDYGAMN